MQFPLIDQQLAFLAPQWLWLLAILPLLWWLLHRNETRRLQRATRLGVTPKQSCPPWLAILLTFLSLCALARPYLGSEQLQMQGRGRDLIIALDISLSMEARDLPPSRLEFAKRKMLDLLAILEGDEAITRVGIVLFSGSAYLFAPLTVDYAVLRHYIDSVDPDLITARGSALDRALEISASSLERTSSTNGSILLLTDGEDLALNRASLQPLLTNTPYPIHALGVGTVDGTTIEFQGRALRDSQGNIVYTKLHPELLIEASSLTGGNYHRASLGDGDLVSIIKALRGSTTEEQIRKNFTLYFEVGPLLVAATLLLLVLFTFRQRAFPLAGLLILFTTTPSLGWASGPTAQELAAEYEQENYEAIIGPLESLARAAPTDRSLQFALGNTYYKLQRFAEARAAYERAMRLDRNGRDRFESHYNLGNTYYRENRFDQAVRQYEAALRIKPNDERTTHNLKLARQKLEAQQSQEPPPSPEATPTPQPQGTAGSDGAESAQPQESEQQSPPTESDSGSSSSSSGEQSSSGESPEEEAQGGSDSEQAADSASAEDASASGGSETRQETPSNSEPEQTQATSSGAPADPQSVQGMQSEEAHAWLESLRDAPLLLQRKHRDRFDRAGGQIW